MTGCGHSGTGWAAAALTAAGIPTGHEQRFGPYAYRDRLGELAGDCAWPAAPFLHGWPHPVAHLTRHPYDVAVSICRDGWLDEMDTPALRVVAGHVPEVLDVEPGIDRAAAYVAHWSALVGTLGAPRWQVETLGAAGVFADLVEHLTGDRLTRPQLAAAVTTPTTGTKPKNRPAPYPPTPVWFDALGALAERWSYPDRGWTG